MKTQKKENWCQDYLTDQKLAQLLAKVDADLAENVKRRGCVHCSGVLHVANYPRKPRGGPQGEDVVYRLSFCCSQECCRKRHTCPSVRFLGRRVYWGFIVVLISAMRHGLTPERVCRLREIVGMDRRTLERWRQWWLEAFAQSRFWKAARARFMPLVCEQTLPLSLCQSFEINRRDRLLDLLQFLSPITSGSFSLDQTD